MMKFKFNLLCTITLLIAVFTGCLPKEDKLAGKEERDKLLEAGYISKKDLSNIKIGYCGPSMVAPYYVALEDEINKNVRKYGMLYYTADGQGDVTKQVAAIEDLLAKGIQILVLNPLDPKAVVPVVNRAVTEGVAVFIVDSMIDEEATYTASVVANNTLNGEVLGLWLAEAKNEALKIAMISGNQGNPVGREKRLGFVRGLVDGQLHRNAKTNFEIVAHGWGGWNNNGGLKAMEDILSAHPYINVLLAENDAMALGAYKVIKQMGKEKQITILGFDGQKEAYEMLQNGKFAATAQNSPKILGRMIIDIVAKQLNGEAVNKLNYTPTVLITKKNVNQYYDSKALF